MATPAGVSAALASGGSLTVGTQYYYVVTALDAAGGETVQSPEVSETPTSGNQTINLSWTAVPGAISYNVYRTITSGSYGATSLAGNPATAPFSDNGVTLTSGSPPTVTTAYLVKMDPAAGTRLNCDTTVTGNLGVGTPDPVISRSTLEVFGNVAVGAYAGVDPAPIDGLILSGDVGIGTHSPQSTVDVNGSINQIVYLRPLGGTSDDRPQIQAAINSLPSNGGIIMLMPGYDDSGNPIPFRIGSQISVTNDGVKLRGYGGTVAGLQGSAVPLTQLLWVGTSGASEIVVSLGNATDLQPWFDALEISDLLIDGGKQTEGDSPLPPIGSTGAGIGLQVSQVNNCKFCNVHVRNMKARASDGSGPSTGMNLVSVGFSLFENCTAIEASFGVVLDGFEDSDCSQDVFIGLSAGSYLANDYDAAIWLKNCDNNSFYRTYTATPQEGYQGYGVLIYGPAHTPDWEYGYLNYFYHLEAQGGLYVQYASAEYPYRNFIYGYDQGQGNEPDPAGDGGPAKNYLSWFDGYGNTNGIGCKRYPDLSGALSASNCPATNASEFGFVWDGTDFWLVYNDGTNKWKWQGTQIT